MKTHIKSISISYMNNLNHSDVGINVANNNELASANRQPNSALNLMDRLRRPQVNANMFGM